MADQKVIEKIEKLLRLSKSDNENEAALAMEHANRLMTEHQLTISDVDVTDTASAGAKRVFYKVKDQRMKLIWVGTLARACARLFDGDVITSPALHGTQFWFVGVGDDVRAATALFEHLYEAWFGIVRHDLDEAKALSDTKFRPKDTMAFKAGHGYAYGNTIFNRATSLAAERKEAVRQNSDAGMALVVLKDQLVSTFMDANSKLKKHNQSFGDTAGREYGRARGNEAALGGAIE